MRMGSKAKLTVATGIIAAAGFAFMGVRELGRADAEVPAQPVAAFAATAPQVVLAATTRDIRTGETIRADMLRTARAAPARWPTAALTSELIGKVATRDIPANSLVPRTAVGPETKLAIRVPMGMRAMSIDTTAEIAVAGLVRPGDRVDVQVVYPGEDALTGARGEGRSQARALLQMVEVLAVGDLVVGTTEQRQPGAAERIGVGGKSAGTTATTDTGPASPARTVTLALSPEQVSQLSLAKATGALTLSLRNPRDASLDAGDGAVGLARAAAAPVREVAAAAPARVVRKPAARSSPPRRAARAAAASSSPAGGSGGGNAIDLVVGGKSRTIYSGSGAQ